MLVLRSSLLLYSKGFALFPFKNGVEIAAVEGVAASIDRHAAPAVVLEPAEASESRQGTPLSPECIFMKITVYLGEITVYFGRNPCSWPAKCDLEDHFSSEYSAPNLIDIIIFSRHKNFFNGSNRPGASVVCNLTCQIAVHAP